MIVDRPRRFPLDRTFLSGLYIAMAGGQEAV
jgi:hypothetical protein